MLGYIYLYSQCAVDSLSHIFLPKYTRSGVDYQDSSAIEERIVSIHNNKISPKSRYLLCISSLYIQSARHRRDSCCALAESTTRKA